MKIRILIIASAIVVQRNISRVAASEKMKSFFFFFFLFKANEILKIMKLFPVE